MNLKCAERLVSTNHLTKLTSIGGVLDRNESRRRHVLLVDDRHVGKHVDHVRVGGHFTANANIAEGAREREETILEITRFQNQTTNLPNIGFVCRVILCFCNASVTDWSA